MAPLLIAFSSGAASLAYQVIWDRLLRLSFGADELSAVLITSTFLLGLGLGAALFARPFRAPLRVYAAVELAIGLFGLASYPLLSSLSSALIGLTHPSFDQLALLRATQVAGVVLFVLPPAVLMGATLPLLFACFAPRESYAPRDVAWIYGLNTAGAVAGGVLAPLGLLGSFRVPVALALVAAVNIALGVALLSMRAQARPAPPVPTTPTPLSMCAASFASGALVLAWELVGLRHLGHLHPGSPYNFALVLLVYLGALAAGAFVLRRITLPTLFAVASVLAGTSVVLTHALLSSAPPSEAFRATGGGLPRLLLHAAVLLGPFAFVQGAVFPALLRAAAPLGAELPARTGPLYLASALGSFVAGLGLHFMGWDRLGTRGVVVVVVAIGAATALLFAQGRRPRLIALIALALVARTPAPAFRSLAMGWLAARVAPADTVEGETGSAALTWDDAERRSGMLWIHGKPFGVFPEDPTWRWAAAWAKAQPQRARVLLLGLGTTTVLRELIADPAVERVDVVDWSAELPPLLRRQQARIGDPLASPKVHLYRSDARTAVSLAAKGSYDLVFESLTHYGPVGSTHYRSDEYYSQVRRILSSDGVLVSVGLRRDDTAVFAAALEHFPALTWFPPNCGIAGARELQLDSVDLAEDPRFAARVTHRATDLVGQTPVRDDALFGEYAVGPGRMLSR